MKLRSLLKWLSIAAIGSGCASKYSVTPSYYSSETVRQVVVAQNKRPPAEAIGLGALGIGATVGLLQFASLSGYASDLEQANYPDESPADVRLEARSWLVNASGAGAISGALLYLGLQYGFPVQRTIYACTASSVGFETRTRLSEEDFKAFMDEGQCKHVHTHGQYWFGLGFLPRNLPNY